MLYRTGTIAEAKVTQLVIPSVQLETILVLLHDTPLAGHPGGDKTLSMTYAKYYWSTLKLDIEKYIVHYLACAETNGTTKTSSILELPLLVKPFDVINIELLQLPHSHQGLPYILVCADHFSRFTVLVPLPNKPISLLQ